MRLNRTTLILLVVCVVVIVGVLVLTSNQASAPDTATSDGAQMINTAAVVGPLLPELAQADVVALELVDNQTGDQVRLARDADAAWAITRATYSTTRATDESAIFSRLDTLLALQANDKFDSDNLADFGLTTPAYILTLTTSDGTLHTIYVGNANPAGNRRYVYVTQSEPGAATPEAEMTATPPPADSTEEPAALTAASPHAARTLDSASGTVFLVVKSAIDNLVALINQPPYVSPPTPTITPTATLNPLSQVDMATLTAAPAMTITAIFESFAATATAAAAEATAEATPEAGQ